MINSQTLPRTAQRLSPRLSPLRPPGALVLAALATICLARVARAADAEPIKRQPGESLANFAKRLTPPGSVLKTKPVEVGLPPLGTVVVIMHLPAKELNNYQGWVFAPASPPGAYRKVVLPEVGPADSGDEYTIRSIFAADADHDGAPELCVLSSIYHTGSGDDPAYMTDVYKWQGDKFVALDETVTAAFRNLRTAKAVRDKLKAPPTGAPGHGTGSTRP